MTPARERLAILFSVIATACSPRDFVPPSSVAEPSVTAREDPSLEVHVLVKSDAGFWIDEVRDVSESEVVGEYGATDLGAMTRLHLESMSMFSRTISGCVGPPLDVHGTWSMDDRGIRLVAKSSRREDDDETTEVMKLARVGDVYVLVPEVSCGDFMLAGPSRSNCLRKNAGSVRAR